jgi:hypothetical protein
MLPARRRRNRAAATWRWPDKQGAEMDEGPSCPAAHRSGAATGAPSGDDRTEFRKAVIQSGRGGVGI